MKTKSNVVISITDNRMEWNMKRNGIQGVTMSWSGEPTLLFEDGMIYPKEYESIRFKEFYRDGIDWPICPITGKKLPIQDDLS